MMIKRRISAALLCGVLMTAACGCEAADGAQSGNADEHITVYLWETRLFDEFAGYVGEQCPGVEIEFIAGNNCLSLYDYLAEHGDLPDIITTRRFSSEDAKALSSCLLDLGGYDVVSSFYPYALQYYTDPNGDIKWLPVCGIPETMILNKTIFDRYGIDIPDSYAEFAQACGKLSENGVKPYCSELSEDWAAHSLVQGAAIDQFASLRGIEWRSQAENAAVTTEFPDGLWTDIFLEVSQFINDTGLDGTDAQVDADAAREMFLIGEAAIFRGTPAYMEAFQAEMEDELVRLPYFSQTSDESWIYTYPSLNISLNRSLEQDEGKLAAAMEVLGCFLSQEGQELIAGGGGLISYNVDVESDLNGMNGIEDEIRRNALYIRYSSNPSFAASQTSVTGLLTGEMTRQQAFEAFRAEMSKPTEDEDIVVEFRNSYPLAVNEKGGREAASAVLTTVRRAIGADLAFTPCYYYTSSIYTGGFTRSEVSMIVKNDDADSTLAMAEINGGEVKALVVEYLKDAGTGFSITNRYRLPVASGMKLILTDAGEGYELKDIEVNGAPIDDSAVYKLLVQMEIEVVFADACPGAELQPLDATLCDVWSEVTGGGGQPDQPEDYIELVK